MAQQYICDNTKINFYMILISCYSNTMCLCSLMHTTMRRAQTRLTVRGTSGSDVLLAADQVVFTGYLTDPLISLMHPSGNEKLILCRTFKSLCNNTNVTITFTEKLIFKASMWSMDIPLPVSYKLSHRKLSYAGLQRLNIGQSTLHGGEAISLLSYQIAETEKWMIVKGFIVLH